MIVPRRPFALAALAALALLASPAAQAADTITVGTVGAGSTTVWMTYIAMEKGFFAKRDVAVDLIAVPSNAGMQQQLAAGALDIGVSGGSPDPIRAVDKGAPNVIIRVDSVASPYSIMAKADIKTPADLKGHTISLDGAKGITRAYLDRIMKPTGLKEGDFDLVFQGSTAARFAALQSGAADAAMLTAPFDSEAEAAGFHRLVLVSDVVKDIPFGVTAGNRPWVLAHQDLVKRFLAAESEGREWFYDPKNRAEAVQIGLHNTKLKQTSLENAYDLFQRIQVFNRSDAVSRKLLENIMDVLIGFHDIDKRIDIDRLVAPEVTRIVD